MTTRVVSPGRGWSWFRQAINLGRNNPKAVFGAVALMAVIALIPSAVQLLLQHGLGLGPEAVMAVIGLTTLASIVVYPLLIAFFSNTPVRKYFSAMKKPQIVAFSTASSMATLPVNMETCERDLKVTNATASFVLPLGATINMSGNAIYYGLVAIFFAQVYNIDLSMGAWAALPGGCRAAGGRDSHRGSAAAVRAGSSVRHDPDRAEHHRRCGLRHHRRSLQPGLRSGSLEQGGLIPGQA